MVPLVVLVEELLVDPVPVLDEVVPEPLFEELLDVPVLVPEVPVSLLVLEELPLLPDVLPLTSSSCCRCWSCESR